MLCFSSHWSINLCFKSTHDKIVVAWETMTCSWLDWCWSFEGNCCLCDISTYLLNTWYHIPEDCALHMCKIWSSHSSSDEDWSVQGCDVVSLGKWFLMFQRIMLRSSSGLKQSSVAWPMKITHVTFLWNVWNLWPDKASHSQDLNPLNKYHHENASCKFSYFSSFTLRHTWLPTQYAI